MIIYNCITHYRKPVFNELGKKYNLTVIHSGQKSKANTDLFEEVIIPAARIGPFNIQFSLFKNNLKNYDVIIGLADVRWLSTIISIFLKDKSQKFILWGAWFTSNKIVNLVRVFLTKYVDANIFYTVKTKNDFINKGINGKNLYVANNTIDVKNDAKSFQSKVKNKIIFVGTLNVRERIRSFHRSI